MIHPEQGLRVGRIHGIEIRVDGSWAVIFLLVAWSLAFGHFPMMHPGWDPWMYVVAGLVGSVLLFGSVLVHELAHSFVAGRLGVPVSGITLYIFGGAAHLTREPDRARDEAWIALAGPISSLFLAAGFFGLATGGDGVVSASAAWLGWVNLVLGIFNLAPGLPLDGGRILRAAVWGATGSRPRATRVAARAGQALGLGLMAWAAWRLSAGGVAASLWLGLIGWVVFSAAQGTLTEGQREERLGKRTAGEAAATEWPRAYAAESLGVLMERSGSDVSWFPVVAEERPVGALPVERIRSIPPAQWSDTTAAQVMLSLESAIVLCWETRVPDAEARMRSAGTEYGLVVDAGGRLIGVLSPRDLAGLDPLPWERGNGDDPGHRS